MLDFEIPQNFTLNLILDPLEPRFMSGFYAKKRRNFY